MTSDDFQPQLPENALPTWSFSDTIATVIGSGPSACGVDWNDYPRPLVAMSSGIRCCPRPDYWFLVDPPVYQQGPSLRWRLYGDEGDNAIRDKDVLKVRPIWMELVEPYWVPDISTIYEHDLEMIGNTMPWAVRSLVKWGVKEIHFVGCDMTTTYPHMTLINGEDRVLRKREEAVLSIAAIDEDVTFVNRSDPNGMLKHLGLLRQQPSV